MFQNSVFAFSTIVPKFLPKLGLNSARFWAEGKKLEQIHNFLLVHAIRFVKQFTGLSFLEKSIKQGSTTKAIL